MPRILFSILSIIWISILPVCGQLADVSVKGKVVDPESRPIEMVNVLIKGTTMGVVINHLGEFILPPVSGKSIVVIFSFVGYETTEKEVLLSGNPFVSQVLKPFLKRIQKIVVEGRGADNRVRAINASILAFFFRIIFRVIPP